MFRSFSLLAILLLTLSPLRSPAAQPAQKLNYSYLYFENGYPTPSSSRRPQSEANLAARANPDLVFQTGYYSLMLGCDDLQIKGYNALPGTDYLTALKQDVTVFTPAASLLLEVVQGGITYQCTHALTQGPSAQSPVRLIESGQYLQRIDHLGLVFKDAQGNVLQTTSECRLEISAWADRVTLFLDFSAHTGNPITQTTIQLVSPGGITHTSTTPGKQSRLTLKPHEDTKLAPLAVNRITTATNLQNGAQLPVTHDADVHALKIEVPANPVSYPSAANRVDEYLIELSNPTGSAENVPLVFNQPNPPAITGTVMVLCDADSGQPLGIPVQISKNWHRKYVDTDGNGSNETYVPTVHDGPWLRGSTLLALQAGETRRFKLRVIYGYWGGAGTISHSQLSLIGYGGNWMWDETALGAWGESLTYDPTQHLGSSFMGDIRPSFTLSYATGNSPYADASTTTMYNWTENAGGGDFLIYRDQANKYRWLKRQKTCYLQTGPNLTEVHYGGVSDDDKIRVTYVSRAVATLDYHRRFHDYKYEFLQDVVTPSRLVFQQMAADFYLSPTFTDYRLGDASGLLNSATIEAGGNVYKGAPIPFDGKWLSIDDTTGGGETARALRGIIPLSSTLNGNPLPLHIHKYGRSYGASTMLFDLSSASVTRSYSAGDVVRGEIEFIMPPQHANNHWGGDAELINRLTPYGDTTWEPVRDEMLHNVQMAVSMHAGSMLRNYPLEIQSSPGKVLADFTVQGGGIGHLPVVIRNAVSGLALKVQRWNQGSWTDLENVDIQNNSYYQALLNADGTTDYTFSIRRPSVNLNDAWRVRVVVNSSVFTWDASVGDGATITSGSGNWKVGIGNWNRNGVDRSWADGNEAIFGGSVMGTAGTVSLLDDVFPSELTFNPPAAGSYVIDLTSFNLATSAVTVSGGTSGRIIATGDGEWITSSADTAPNLELTGSLTLDAPVTGPGALFAAGAGNLKLTNSANRFSGVLGKQDGGEVAFSSIAASGQASAAGAGSELRIGSNARAVHTGSGSQTNRTFVFFGEGAGTLDNDGTGPLVWAGPFSNMTSAGGARKLTLGGSNTGDNHFQGVLSDHPSNGSTLVLEKNDAGTWVISGNNTYSGSTTVSQGILKVRHGNSLGSTAGGTIVADGAKLELDGSGGNLTLAESITLGGGTGGLRNLSGSNTLTGAITLAGNADFRRNSGTVTFKGGVTSLANQSFNLNGVATFETNPIDLNNGTMTFTSAGNNASNSSHLKTGGNDWSVMRINFGGYLTVGGANYLPTDAAVEFGWDLPEWSSATLNLNGFDQTVASLAQSFNSFDEGGDINITGGGTLTIDLPTGTKEYQGRITDGGTPTAVVKMGGGTQILNNLSGTPNSWSGNTTVSGGTLRIRSSTLADASTVSISPGAVLDLAFPGTDTVKSLFIGATRMAAGAYGVSGINLPEITGTGTLTVTGGPVESFSTWITRTFSNGTVSISKRGPGDDPDHDGLDNLIEYGLGKDPTVSSQPAGVRSGNLLTYTKGADAIANRDVSWVIETSETLAAGSWTPQVSQPAGDATPTISYLLTPAGPPRKFARLKLTQE